jgi:hypothetical protein
VILGEAGEEDKIVLRGALAAARGGFLHGLRFDDMGDRTVRDSLGQARTVLFRDRYEH